MTSVSAFSLRGLQEGAETLATPAPSLEDVSSSKNESNESQSDSSVFWFVNVFILILLLSVCSWYCCCGGIKRMTRHGDSDQTHQRRVQQRRQEREKRHQMTPEERKQSILKSFQRNQVKMLVTENDFVDDSQSSFTEDIVFNNNATEEKDGQPTVLLVSTPPSPSAAEQKDLCDEDDFDAASNAQGNLVLRHDALHKDRLVPNCCAICLSGYDKGDTVVWSSNPDCQHAFHEDCLLDWLVHSKQEGTPCPCCRQSFTDLKTFRKERKVRWAADNAFDPSILRL